MHVIGVAPSRLRLGANGNMFIYDFVPRIVGRNTIVPTRSNVLTSEVKDTSILPYQPRLLREYTRVWTRITAARLSVM